MTDYLMDSMVLIDWLKGRRSAVELLDELSARRPAPRLAVNAVSVGETYAGIAPHDLEETTELVGQFPFWELTFAMGRLAGEYKYRYDRMGRPLAIPDMLLAAHAVTVDATLITANIKDFPMPELKILRYDR